MITSHSTAPTTTAASPSAAAPRRVGLPSWTSLRTRRPAELPVVRAPPVIRFPAAVCSWWTILAHYQEIPSLAAGPSMEADPSVRPNAGCDGLIRCVSSPPRLRPGRKRGPCRQHTAWHRGALRIPRGRSQPLALISACHFLDRKRKYSITRFKRGAEAVGAQFGIDTWAPAAREDLAWAIT